MNIDYEQRKLADLEFEYNIARMSNQDEEIIRQAKGRYRRQLNKVLKYQRIRVYEKKTKDSTKLLEKLF